jgi:hypothetical protein
MEQVGRREEGRRKRREESKVCHLEGTYLLLLATAERAPTSVQPRYSTSILARPQS